MILTEVLSGLIVVVVIVIKDWSGGGSSGSRRCRHGGTYSQVKGETWGRESSRGGRSSGGRGGKGGSKGSRGRGSVGRSILHMWIISDNQYQQGDMRCILTANLLAFLMVILRPRNVKSLSSCMAVWNSARRWKASMTQPGCCCHVLSAARQKNVTVAG